MPDHYDSLEIRERVAREESLMAALPRLITHAKASTSYYARMLADVDASAITSRDALARLPLTRKSQLIELQRTEPPLGGLAARPVGRLARVFMSPGPIFEPQGRRDDYWRMARPLFAAGFRSGDLIHNSFSYHLTPAGAMIGSGAAALGCAVFPGGVGQTELQLAAIAHLRPNGYAGTPSFLRILVEQAKSAGTDISSLQKALVSGEPLPASLRTFLEENGIRTTQTYATADLGNIAYESEAREGLILDEEIVVEIVRPGTGEPVPEGEVGEIVVTTLGGDYPLVRFATGDLSAVLPGMSSCGRTNRRIRGWMGRADQATKVRGMFVHPAQVAEVLKRHAEAARGRLVVDSAEGQDRMTLKVESQSHDPALAAALQSSIRDVTKLRGDVEFVAPGALPNDGKVIEDLRKFE